MPKCRALDPNFISSYPCLIIYPFHSFVHHLDFFLFVHYFSSQIHGNAKFSGILIQIPRHNKTQKNPIILTKNPAALQNLRNSRILPKKKNEKHQNPRNSRTFKTNRPTQNPTNSRKILGFKEITIFSF